MARQVLTIGAGVLSANGENLDFGTNAADSVLAVLIDSELTAGGATAFLRFLRVNHAPNPSLYNIFLRTSATSTDAPSAGGPDLTPAWETNPDERMTYAAGGLSLTLPGGVPFTHADTTEPYQFRGANAAKYAEFAAFTAAYDALSDTQKAATTLTLDDGAVPDAVAPSLAVTAADVDEGGTTQVNVVASGGTYDALARAYAVQSGGGSVNSSGLYTAPSVSANADVTVRVTGTATGDGTTAADGTSATVTQDVVFTVRNVPVGTTDTDSVWRLDTSQPATPTGGTSTQTHTPSGWTRSEPSPTETQGVWRSQRTRSYSDGSFTSATSWGTPTETAGATGAGLTLADWVQPAGTENVVLALAAVVVDGVDLCDFPGDLVGDDNDIVIGPDLSFDQVERRGSPDSPVRLRRTGTSGFNQYFGSGDIYEGATFWIQTSDRVIRFVERPGGPGGGFYNWNYADDSDATAYEAITTGDRFIVAITVPASSVSADIAFRSGAPAVNVTPAAKGVIRHLFASGAPSVAITPSAKGVIRHLFQSGAPRVAVTTAAVDALRTLLRSGSPQVSARVTQKLLMVFRSGAPRVAIAPAALGVIRLQFAAGAPRVSAAVTQKLLIRFASGAPRVAVTPAAKGVIRHLFQSGAPRVAVTPAALGVIRLVVRSGLPDVATTLTSYVPGQILAAITAGRPRVTASASVLEVVRLALASGSPRVTATATDKAAAHLQVQVEAGSPRVTAAASVLEVVRLGYASGAPQVTSTATDKAAARLQVQFAAGSPAIVASLTSIVPLTVTIQSGTPVVSAELTSIVPLAVTMQSGAPAIVASLTVLDVIRDTIRSGAPTVRVSGTSAAVRIRPTFRSVGPTVVARLTPGGIQVALRTSTAPLFPLVRALSASAVEFSWSYPLDDGRGTVTSWQVCVIRPGNITEAYLPVEPTETAGRYVTVVKGLGDGRYGLRARAVNSQGNGTTSELVEVAPTPVPEVVVAGPLRLPMVDTDRQSFVARLASVDCRITVWWQPRDESWYASIEVPTNTVLVSVRRLVAGAGLLDGFPDALPGNVVCRDLGAGRDPARDVWRTPTHALVWEPDA